ncbi:MAG TPA: aspartate kinase [Terriglobales bacterium]|nr:aspartate kinase [Terriglobales bacterium]
MSLIVMKFGGTSVGDAERIRESARRVAECVPKSEVVTVVSALAGVTDHILKTVTAARQGEQATVEAQLRALEERHEGVIRELFVGKEREQVESRVGAVLRQLHDFCSALLMLRSSTAQILDVAAPMGEKMSAQIFVAVLRQMGLNAEYVDSTQVLVTDDHFGDASADMAGTEQKSQAMLLPLVQSGKQPVVTGYAGATAKGQPTTLGRGGSDSSATILGAAIGCDEVWIWTDVDGVLTADPRVCPDASTLPEITFAEAVELSYYGAKVIHHKAIRPVMDRGIPVWIKNSFRPEVKGTKITSKVAGDGSPVKAVTVVKQASLINLRARQDTPFAELFGRLFLRLGHEHVDVLFSTQSSSENALGLVLRDADTENVVKLIERLFRVELQHGVIHPIFVQREVAVICVLGEAMRGTPGILSRLFTAVAARNQSVISVAQGASELNICFAVNSSGADEVVKAVHDEFLSSARVPAVEKTV